MQRAIQQPAPRYFGKVIDSPVGPLKLVASERGLAAILWANDDPRRVPLGEIVAGDSHAVLLEAERQLGEYFAGQREQFALPMDFRGTEFQRRVWRALLTIPFGETRSYAQLAQQIGRPAAVRAVGAANGRNPLSIIAPCHRVLGSNGKLIGFAGGLEAKAKLLSLERLQTKRSTMRDSSQNVLRTCS
ncbi:MAG: methylated-DNA--[protein]-cysteine S-methyltransferase [Pseudomonadota bacterium]|nr:methylated-DNA--[protein]-cysteine S-methyltransferase [Pseudomonadota bacterium]